MIDDIQRQSGPAKCIVRIERAIDEKKHKLFGMDGVLKRLRLDA